MLDVVPTMKITACLRLDSAVNAAVNARPHLRWSDSFGTDYIRR